MMNHGTKPSRARSGTTKESKEKYIRTTLKAAGVTPATDSRQEANNVIDDTEEPEAEAEETMMSKVDNRQELSNRGWEVNLLLDYDTLYHVEEGQFVENPLASTEDITNPQGQSIKSGCERCRTSTLRVSLNRKPFSSNHDRTTGRHPSTDKYVRSTKSYP